MPIRQIIIAYKYLILRQLSIFQICNRYSNSTHFMQFTQKIRDTLLTQNRKQLNTISRQSQQITINISNGYQQLGKITIDPKCTVSQLVYFVRRKFLNDRPIACLASKNKREVLDYLLLIQQQTLNFLKDNQHLVIIYEQLPFGQDKPSLRDFMFLKCLGQGGSASVFLVRHKTNGRLYALKQIQKSYFIQFKRMEQVLRQKKIMTQILQSFPFVSQLFATFQSENHLNFLLQFYPGGEMFYHLQLGRLSQDQAKLYFCQMLITLQFLHSKQIVYRDLKPQNILIDVNGHARLADFGLCKINLSSDDLTNSYCGSLQYMAPQIKENQGYNYSVDFYALGAFLYEMVVGIPPYYNNQPLSFPQQCSRGYCNLVSKLIEENVMDRLTNFRKIKQSAWLRDIDWQKILQKQYKMPIKLNSNHSYVHQQFRQVLISDLQLKKQQKYDKLFDFFFYMKNHPIGIYKIYTNQSKFLKNSKQKISKFLSGSKRKKQLSVKSSSSKSSKKSLNLHKQNEKIQNIYTFRKKKLGSKELSNGSKKSIQGRQSSLPKNTNIISFNRPSIKTVKSQNHLIKPYQGELLSKIHTQILNPKYIH